MLRSGERFPLRIGLSRDPRLQTLIDKVTSVRAKAPDAEAFSLDIVPSSINGALSAVVF